MSEFLISLFGIVFITSALIALRMVLMLVTSQHTDYVWYLVLSAAMGAVGIYCFRSSKHR